MQNEQIVDWIEQIVDKVNEYYANREIVLWGKYTVSECIEYRLKEKYNLDTAFYVDSDVSKIDNKQVFTIDSLGGMSKRYYVVIPIAFYQSVKDTLLEAGYKPDIDYYYFCDCILVQKPDYYEDGNGNKIIGEYHGLKFAFSGFGSVIHIGDGVEFSGTSLYIHSKSKIVIGNNTQLTDSKIVIQPSGQIRIGADVVMSENHINMENDAYLEVGNSGSFTCLSMELGKGARAIFHEEVKILANKAQRASWIVKKDANVEVGMQAEFYSAGALLILDDKAKLKIGREFSIGIYYYIWLGRDNEVIVGKDCLFSQNLIMRCNDGHSLFDVETGRNINSTHEITKTQKIVIGNHVWLGIHCTILYNTKIEDGSVIGAMSLVKGSIPNNCIAAGVPAKVIRRNIAWSREDGADSIEKCGMEYIHLTNESV